MKFATAVVALAALRAIASAAPLGSLSLPISALTLAAEPVFAIPSDHGINGPSIDAELLLLDRNAPQPEAPAEPPSYVLSVAAAGISGGTLAAFLTSLFLSRRAVRARSLRKRRRSYAQRTMAFI